MTTWKHVAAIALLVSLRTTTVEAQVAKGVVIDASSSSVVDGAVVIAVTEAGDSVRRVISDRAGSFVLAMDGAGSYRFRVEHIGYAVVETELLHIEPGEVVTVEIRLGPAPVSLEPLAVRARQRAAMGSDVFYRRMGRLRRSGRGTFITRADIDGASAPDMRTLINRHVRTAGAVWRPSDALGSRCFPALWLDGVQLSERDDIFAWVRPENVEGVELYMNPQFVPPELANHRGCGAIAVWTRR